MYLYKNLTIIVLSIAAVWSMTACQKGGVASTPANTTTNTAAANTSSANTANTATSTTGPVDLSTPTATYKTAYNARKNKDIPTLKKVLSKDVLDFLTEIGNTDDSEKKTLDEMLKDLCEQPQAPNAEARNEKIEGDKASIEYLDETGAWHSMDMVKENGEWKITIGKEDKPTTEDNKPANKTKEKK